MCTVIFGKPILATDLTKTSMSDVNDQHFQEFLGK